MILLVDTHIVLWSANESPDLPQAARSLIEGTETVPCFSAASIWEVAIKLARSKPGFSVNPRSLRAGLLQNGWREIPVTGEHAAATLDLPAIHKDPFDRLIVVQAVHENLVLMTSDRILARYPGNILMV